MNAVARLRSPVSLLSHLGIEEPTEIDVEAIAQFCGVTIVYERLEGCEARIVGAGHKAIVTVNKFSPRPRQRFSAAHELGHWTFDRGKIAFACAERQFVGEWSGQNPERRANQYATELLLPRNMFKQRARHQSITFDTVRSLAQEFQTSLTATAIRLVELGSYPALIVCTDRAGRKWFQRSHLVPASLWPRAMPGESTVAAKLLDGQVTFSPPVDVSAHQWIDHQDAARYIVREDSAQVAPGLVLSLIWWVDEQQIADLQP